MKDRAEHAARGRPCGKDLPQQRPRQVAVERGEKAREKLRVDAREQRRCDQAHRRAHDHDRAAGHGQRHEQRIVAPQLNESVRDVLPRAAAVERGDDKDDRAHERGLLQRGQKDHV